MIVRFLAVLLTGLAVIAPGAHLFELFRKMRLAEDQYYVVQQIYLGWWLVGLLLPAALIANIALAATAGSSIVRWLAVVAAALVATNLLVFAIWTQPVNTATDNWTMRVSDWDVLRRQREYSHAANAGITIAAFCATVLAALRAT
jgi:L-alanine-DL-glutamate epimerase-like enolase superfamily enzyme